jgi:hypothetical protein
MLPSEELSAQQMRQTSIDAANHALSVIWEGNT